MINTVSVNKNNVLISGADNGNFIILIFKDHYIFGIGNRVTIFRTSIQHHSQDQYKLKTVYFVQLLIKVN